MLVSEDNVHGTAIPAKSALHHSLKIFQQFVVPASPTQEPFERFGRFVSFRPSFQLCCGYVGRRSHGLLVGIAFLSFLEFRRMVQYTPPQFLRRRRRCSGISVEKTRDRDSEIGLKGLRYFGINCGRKSSRSMRTDPRRVVKNPMHSANVRSFVAVDGAPTEVGDRK